MLYIKRWWENGSVNNMGMNMKQLAIIFLSD